MPKGTIPTGRPKLRCINLIGSKHPNLDDDKDDDMLFNNNIVVTLVAYSSSVYDSRYRDMLKLSL
jgi:hypothetical protein